MSTSLAEQLQRLAVPQTAVLKRDKKRPSLLFDPKEAATLTRETVYQIAFQGYEELRDRNEAFAQFENTLFHVTSKEFERSVQDVHWNESLDKNIRKFLLLVSPYFLLSASHKALEWLIHRFSIHEYNKNEFLLLILPYHETNIFVRALQLVKLRETNDNWLWLKSLQKPGIHLPKLVLYNHAASDPHFLKVISNHVIEAVMLHENPNDLTVLLNFYCLTFTGSLEYVSQVNEAQVTQMLRVLLKGTVSDVPDFCAGSYVVLAKLLSRTGLSHKALNKFVDIITRVQIPVFKRQALLLLIILYQTQKQFSEMSQQAIMNLSEKSWLPKLLQELKSEGNFIEPFLKPLFRGTLKEALLEVARHSSKALLNALLKEVKLDDAFVTDLINVIGSSYKPNKEKYPEETKLWIRDFMWKIETQYPTAFDKKINEIMKVNPGSNLTKRQKRFQELLGNSHLEDKMSVFKRLHHPAAGIRQDAIRLIIKRYRDLKDRDRDFFSKTVLNKLRDENCEVVCETLIHSKEILTELLGVEALTKVLTALLTKAQRRKEEWRQVLRPTLEILCSNTGSNDVGIFLRLLPFLLPTDESELEAARLIIDSPYLEKCDFLHPLGNQLRRARTAEKFFTIIYDGLSVNANKPDAPELVNALKEVPESDRDVVHRYLASLLLCSSLQENCEPQMSSIVLDVLLMYLDGTKLHAVKSELTVSNYIIAARKDRFPLQGFLHCLNTLILKTRPMAISPGLFDFSRNNGAFHCTLLDVLLKGCYSTKQSLSLLYAETLKIYFDHLCGDFKSKMEFFLNVSVAECDHVTPALQLRCLHSVASLLGVKHEDISCFLDLDEVVVPYVLVSLASKHKAMRACAVNVVHVLLSIVGTNRVDNYTPLLKHVFSSKEHVVMDQEQTGVVICDVLNSSKFGAVLNTLLNLIFRENYPFYLRARLVEILSHGAKHFEVFDKISGVALGALKQFDVQKSAVVYNCLKRISVDVASDLRVDTNVYRLLERALRSDCALKIDGETLNLSVLAIDQIDGVFDGLSFDTKSALLDVVIEVASVTRNPDVSSAAGHLFKHMNLVADLVLKQLVQMRDVQSPKSLITLKRKRRVSVIPSADILDTLEWRKGVTILEFVQDKKKIESSSVLLPLLFELLKKCLDFDEQAPLEYTKQLILTGVLNLCDRTVEESVPENAFNMEAIVQCIRASPNPQTHHHALLVLARSSRFLPRQVLHHVMAVFTFMGSSVLRHDDAYSFQVINKIIDTIIPILIEDESRESTLRILRVFVDAVLDVPEHRRMPLYRNLLERLDAKENLHLFFLLVFEAHVFHANAEKQRDPLSSPKRLDVAVSLTLEFPADVVISNCIKLMEYLRALPAEKQGDTASSAFDIAHYTPKQFRHYKYVLVTFVVKLLTLPEFVNKIAAFSDGDLLELEPLYKSMIINTLMYVQAVSKISDRNSNTPHAQYWKVMLHHTYDILDSVNALLTPQMFLLVVRGLTTHQVSAIQRRSLELLNSKLQHSAAFFNDCEEAELYAMIPPLINIIKQVETKVEVDSEQEVIIQTALLSLKLFTRRLARDQPAKFVQILEFITNLVKAKKVRGNILASMVLCLAELCANLRAFAISGLGKFMPVVIKLLKTHKQEDLPDLLLLSCVTAVQKIIESLPLFLSPYLEKLLCELSCVSAKWNADVKDPKLAAFVQKLTGIQQKIGSMIPARVLIPIIDSSYKKLVGKAKFSSVKPLMSVLAENLSHLSGTEIPANMPDLTTFFLNALQFRADFPEAADEVEECVVKALVALILKLSESTFRPLYYKIFDWAIRSDVKNERVITFYALSGEVAHSLKGLFVLFAGHFLNNASAVLDACNAVKTKHLYFDVDEKNIALTENVLKTLRAICLYDGQRFVNKERFDVLMQPLVDQLENSLGGLESLANRADALVIPCIVQFCVAAGDDALWKQLNYQVLLKARDPQSEIRLIALKCLNELVGKLGEDFMPLLPETIPFLAELLEDDEETVEKACQKVVRDMEKVLGEPLQKYF